MSVQYLPWMPMKQHTTPAASDTPNISTEKTDLTAERLRCAR